MKYRPHATHPRGASLLQFTFAFMLGMMALSLCGTAAAQDTRYKLVSPAFAEGHSGDQHSYGPSISADGRFIAFTSQARNLVSFPTSGGGSHPGSGTQNVFLRDVQSATTKLVSVNSAGTGSGNGNSTAPSISADGRFVTFLSTSSDLVADDPNGNGVNTFIRDTLTDTTTLADPAPGGGSQSSADGGVVLLPGAASDSGTGLDVRDLRKGSAAEASPFVLEFPQVFLRNIGSAVSADGRYVVFTYLYRFFDSRAGEVLKAGVARYDTATDTYSILPDSGICNNGPPLCTVNIFRPSISADGRFVTFAQTAIGNFVSEGVFLGDFINRTTTNVTTQGLLSFNAFPSVIIRPVISADGRSVAFSTHNRLLPQDTNQFVDVYRFDHGTIDPAGVNGMIRFGQPAFRAEEGGGSVMIPVLRNAFGATGPATVDYATGNSFSATPGSDFAQTSGTLTFGDGEDVKFINVPITDDGVAEGVESFSLTLSNPTGGYALDGVSNFAQVFIHESVRPTLTISDAATTEGGDAVFTVTLSGASARFFAVNFSTANGTAQQSTFSGDFVAFSGTLFFGLGETSTTITVHTTRDLNVEQDETFFLNLSPVMDDFDIARGQGVGTIHNDNAPVVEFSPQGAGFLGSEQQGSATITVRRTAGDPSVPFSVNYATTDGTASERSDYIAALGRLDFAAGETTKTFNVLVNDDAFVEITETVTLSLSAPTNGASVGTGVAALLIDSNDTAPPASNPIDDPRPFVAQQYRDFLNRAPDTAGLDFWTGELNRLTAPCESRPTAEARAGCVLIARAQISTAFFLSIEFQQTSYEVIRFYQATFARAPTLREFLADAQEISRDVRVGAPGWEAKLEANRQKFADEWVQRPAFRAAFDTASNSEYVRRLFTNGAGDANAEPALQAALVSGLGTGGETRATALRKAAGSGSVFNRQYNPAFVLMQYFGYMHRNPADPPDTGLGGFNFWLTKLDQFSLAGEDMRDPDAALSRIRRAQMVESFIDSIEYRNRFGP